MKAISLRQPWASLVVIGAKKFETRSWPTKYRGPLLIHASKAFLSHDQTLMFTEPFWSALGERADPYNRGIRASQCLPTGAIIGRVEVMDCIKTEIWLKNNMLDVSRLDGNSFELCVKSDSAREYAFGDFSFGRWAWELTGAVEFRDPVPCRGSLGLWEFDETALGQSVVEGLVEAKQLVGDIK